MKMLSPGYGQFQFPPEYEAYNTQYPGAKEVIGWTFYDTVTYTSTTDVALKFFDTIRANTSLSNMEAAGSIASPQAFFIRAIGWRPVNRPRATVTSATANTQPGIFDDVVQLGNTGVFSLTIGQKLYGRYPMWRLPAGGGASGYSTSGDVDVNTDYANNGIPDARNVFSLAQPIFLAPQINFKVELNWATALTLAFGNTPLQVLLDGDLIRPVQ